MQQFQQEKPAEILKIFLKAYQITEDKGKIKPLEDIETPLILVENIENFKENCFWVNIKNLWILIAKVPPVVLTKGDFILFREKNKWGMFKYLGEEKEEFILTDAKEKRKTKVKKDIIFSLSLFGKILRVQNKV